MERVKANPANSGANQKPTKLTADDFATRIASAWQTAVKSIIETGRLLIEAQEALGHGKWQTMFEGKNKLQFSERTAQRLMTIARHPVIANPAHVSHLPAAWGTLHALTRLPQEELEVLIAKGMI